MGANQLADEHDSEQTEQELAMFVMIPYGLGRNCQGLV